MFRKRSMRPDIVMLHIIMRPPWVVEGLESYETNYARCATSPKQGRSRACHMLLYKKALV
jgi:hypothetical protein